MSRRGWLLNLAAGSCVGLLAACNTFRAGIDDAPPELPQAWWNAQLREPVQRVVAATPAHAATNNLAKTPTPPASKEVEPAAYSPPLKRELLEPPPSLSEVQVTSQQPAAPPTPDLDVAHLEVKAAKPVTDSPLVAALRCFMDKRPAEAVELLRHYDQLSQDLLLCMFPLAARLAERGSQRIDGQEATALVTQLRRLEAALEPRATLVIDKMCFTQRIYGFGVYVPWKEDQLFRPSDRVEVYIELKNFSNEKIADGYAVRLSSSVEVREYKGAYAWGGDLQERPSDLTKSPRRDCFYLCAFDIPAKCPPGMYTLWLRVKDVPTGRTASRSLDFQVAPARGRDF